MSAPPTYQPIIPGIGSTPSDPASAVMDDGWIDSSLVSTSQSCLYPFSDRDSAIAFSDRIKSGVVGEQLWLQISEPTEKDMGKYAIEFNDGKGGLRRTVELSGQGEFHCSLIQRKCVLKLFHLYFP